jgi:hypothetical protein
VSGTAERNHRRSVRPNEVSGITDAKQQADGALLVWHSVAVS